jgi:alkanesulfonate monooxygenase SsuD/methylene tetrahydromethanopterin reductase-like flavin-dependent oxidoreductase (luciferase family)
VIIGLLTQTTTDFAGEHYRLQQARCEPKPVQRPHPPIVIGGGGEKRTLRSVARYAQHWNYPGGPVEDFARKRKILDEHCADVGRDPSEIMTSTHLRLAADGDTGPLVESAAAYAEAGLDMGIIYLPAPHTPAVLEPVAQALRGLT